jgi:hypothetical protein
MRVRCVSNTGAGLPSSFLDERGGYRRNTKYEISLHRVYTVYALTLRRGHVWYYICDDRELGYPVWHPAPLFEVVDPTLSRYWIFAHGSPERDGDVVFAFREWADDPGGYYDRLSDREPEATGTFRRYRQLMDAEGLDSGS